MCAAVTKSKGNRRKTSSGSVEYELFLAHRGALLSTLVGQNPNELAMLLFRYRLISPVMKEGFLSLEWETMDKDRQLRVQYLLQLVYEQVRCDKDSFDNVIEWLKTLKGEGEKVYDILCKERATGSVGEAGEVQDTERCLTEGDIPDLIGVMASVAHMWEEISIALKIPIRIQEDIKSEGGSSIVKLKKVLYNWVLGDCLNPVTTSTLKQVLAGPIVGVPSIADKIPTMNRSPVHSRPGRDTYPSVDTPKILYESKETQVSFGRSNLLEIKVANASNSVSFQWYKDSHKLSDGGNYQGTKSSILLIQHRNMASKHIEGIYVCQVDGKISSNELSVKVHYPDRIKLLLDKYKRLKEVPKDSWPPRHAESFVELALINRYSDNLEEYAFSVRGDIDNISKETNKIDYYQAFGMYKSGALVLVEGRPGCGKTTLAHKVTSDWSRGENVLVGAELVFLIPLKILNITQKDRNFLELTEHIYSFDTTTNIGEYVMCNEGNKTCFILDGYEEYQRKSKNLNTFVEKLIKGEKLSKAMIIVFSRPIGCFQLKKNQTIDNQIKILGFKKDRIYSYIDSYFDNNTDMAQGLKEYLDQHINVLHMCYLPVHASMICYLYSQERDNLPTTETEIYTHFTTFTIFRKLMREDSGLKKVDLVALSEKNKEQLFEICKLAFEMTVSSKHVFCRSKDSIQLIDEFGSDGPSLGLVTIDIGAKTQGYEDFYSFLHLTFQEYLAAYYINQLENEKQLEILRGYKDYESMLVVWKFYCGLIGMNPDSVIQDKIKIIISSKHADFLYRVHCAFESQHSLSCDAVLNNSERILSFEKTIFRLFDYKAISFLISKSSGPLELKFYACTFDENGISHLLAKTADSRWKSVKALLVHNKEMTLEQLHSINVLLRKLKFLQVLDLCDTTLAAESDIVKLTNGVALPELKCIKIPFIPVMDNYMKVLQLLRLNSRSTFESVHVGPTLNSSDTQLFINCLQSSFNSCDIIGGNFDKELIVLSNIELNKHLHFHYFSHFTTLELKNCGIDNNLMIRICEGLKKSLLTIKIVLDYNKISGVGAAELASSLQCFSTLEHLSIACNLIDDSGAKSLASVLCKCTSLVHLNLEGNRIGDEGAAAITEAVKDKKLELFLWNDIITVDVKRVLSSDGITHIESPLSGDLSFVSDNVKSLTRVLKCCTSLPSIKYSMNIENKRKTSSILKVLLKELPHGSILKELTLNFGNTYGIDKCNVTALADYLKSCMNIQTLDVGNNKICSEGAAILLEGLKPCSKLQRLNISKNHIFKKTTVELAEFFKCWINLQELDISGDDIGSEGAAKLALGLMSCNKLLKLNISRNSIGSEGAVALTEGLKCWANLQELDISWNSIGSEGVTKLFDCLKSCIKLQRLNVSGNYVCKESTVGLAEGLECWINLQELDVSWNNIGLEGAAILAGGLKSCIKLQTLDISKNDIGSKGRLRLIEGLVKCINLQRLDMTLNDIGSQGAVELAEGLKCWTNLQALYITENDIGSKGAMILAEGIKTCVKLQRLEICRNHIDSKGAVELAEGIKYCTNLQELAIGGNNIGLEGTAKLAQSLKSCIKLLRLDISATYMHSESAAKVGEGLKSCIKLQRLDISGNHICSEGAVKLAEGLKFCTSLLNLDISKNFIGVEGASKLGEGLKPCIKLQKLNISNNNIGSEGTVKLAKGLKMCNNLKEIDISWNNIDGIKLAKGLKSCTNLQDSRIDVYSELATKLDEGLNFCPNIENSIDSEGEEELTKFLNCSIKSI